MLLYTKQCLIIIEYIDVFILELYCCISFVFLFLQQHCVCFFFKNFNSLFWVRVCLYHFTKPSGFQYQATSKIISHWFFFLVMLEDIDLSSVMTTIPCLSLISSITTILYSNFCAYKYQNILEKHLLAFILYSFVPLVSVLD